MKKVLSFYFVLVIIATSCSTKDEVAPATINATWQAVSAIGNITAFGQAEKIDEKLESQNVIYTFKEDGTFTSNGTIDMEGSVEKTAISGKYTLTGNTLKLVYKHPQAKIDAIEYYTATIGNSDLKLTMTLDQLKKGITESDPASASLLGIFTAFNIEFTFKKK